MNAPAALQRVLAVRAEQQEALSKVVDEIGAYLSRVSAAAALGRLHTAVANARALAGRRQHWYDEIQTAVRALDERQRQDIEVQIGPLRDTIRAIFGRSQAHEVIDQLDVVLLDDGGIDWRVNVGAHQESEMRTLSRGQRQDLALSVFLARAVSIGGTVFMDEPLLHLDDLNRAGLLDTLRVIAQEHGQRVRIVMTTADRMLVRHLREKFDLLMDHGRAPLLQILTLSGAPEQGVRTTIEHVVRKPEFDQVTLLSPQGADAPPVIRL